MHGKQQVGGAALGSLAMTAPIQLSVILMGALVVLQSNGVETHQSTVTALRALTTGTTLEHALANPGGMYVSNNTFSH